MSESLTASRPDLVDVSSRPTEPEVIVPAPTPTSAPGVNGHDKPIPAEPLARIEDKTSRIEEKIARSEDSMQRALARFEMATNRMNEVASQAELAAGRGEVAFISRRIRTVPGWTALVGSSVVTAILTAIVIILLLRFFPGPHAR